MAKEAAQEAESLVRLLGINPAQLLRSTAGVSQTMLPSIRTWYEDPVSDNDEDEDESGNESTYDDENDDAEELQALMDAEEQTSEPRTNKQDDEILALTCASLAVTADDLIKV